MAGARSDQEVANFTSTGAEPDAELVTTVKPSEHHSVEYRRQYNASLPISKIPPELVAKIIELDRILQIFPCNGYLGWVRLCHVFHYWRSVALETCSLWRCIPLHGGEMDRMREWLSRAKNAPLSIHPCLLDVSEEEHEETDAERLDAYNLIMNEMDHIQSLVVVLPDEFMSEVEWPIITAETLKTLVLMVGRRISAESYYPVDFPVATKFPKLTFAEVTNVDGVWAPGAFPASLKRLKLTFDVSTAFQPCSLEEILRVLEGLPNLEVLAVYNALPFPVDSLCEMKVKLPKLTGLRLEASSEAIIRFLSCITFPTCTRLWLDCWLDHDFLPLAETLAAVSTRFNGAMKESSDLGPIRTCRIRFNDRDLLPSLAISSWKSIQSTEPSSVPDHYIRFMVENTGVTMSGLWHNHLDELPRFCDTLPLAETEVLHLEGWPLHRSREALALWFNFFVVKFQKVRKLHIVANEADEGAEMALPTLLRFAVPTNTREDSAFPSLEELHLRHFKFEAESLDWDSSAPAPFSQALAVLLRSMARQSLVALNISSCYDIFEEDVEALRVAARQGGTDVVVHWDCLTRRAPPPLRHPVVGLI